MMLILPNGSLGSFFLSLICFEIFDSIVFESIEYSARIKYFLQDYLTSSFAFISPNILSPFYVILQRTCIVFPLIRDAAIPVYVALASKCLAPIWLKYLVTIYITFDFPVPLSLDNIIHNSSGFLPERFSCKCHVIMLYAHF